jgi:uncharacterized protein YkwD
VVRLVNAERQKAGLKPLSVDSRLQIAAQAHASDMAQRNFYAHNSPEGKTPRHRFTTAGLPGNIAWGENIAAGVADPGAGDRMMAVPSACGWDERMGPWVEEYYASPEGAMTLWIASPGHRANILNPGFTHIGVGYSHNPGSQWKDYWCQDFAALPNGQPAPTPPPIGPEVTGYSHNPVKAGERFVIQGRNFGGGNLFASHATTSLEVIARDPDRITVRAPDYAAPTAATVVVRIEGTEARGPVLTVTPNGTPVPTPTPNPTPTPGELEIVVSVRRYSSTRIGVWAQARVVGQYVSARIRGTVGSAPLVEQSSSPQRAASWGAYAAVGTVLTLSATDAGGRTGTASKTL